MDTTIPKLGSLGPQNPSFTAATHNTSPFVQLLHLTILLSILPPLYYLSLDYRAYISLGPGGTPSTPLGYIKIRFLSLFALKDPYDPTPIHPHYEPGVLHTLPNRGTPRPIVKGIAPHRQLTQRSGQDLFRKLSSALRGMIKGHESELAEGTSCFEKHGMGLFSLAPVVRTCRGEICHVHPSDGSMHLCLHPADAKVLIESGWGERHPLSGGGWLRRFVPREFVMVYAPRNENDIAALLKIVGAAAWWVSGRKIGDKTNLNEKMVRANGEKGMGLMIAREEFEKRDCDFNAVNACHVQI